MDSATLLLSILNQKHKKATEYFRQIALGNKTEIKYGFVKDSISITFLITGKPQQKEISMSKKMEILFVYSGLL